MNDKKGVYRALLDRAHEAARVAIETKLKELVDYSVFDAGDVWIAIGSSSKFRMWCNSRASAKIRLAGSFTVGPESQNAMKAAKRPAEAEYGSLSPSGAWTFRIIGGFDTKLTPKEAMMDGARAFCGIIREAGISIHWKERDLSVAS